MMSAKEMMARGEYLTSGGMGRVPQADVVKIGHDYIQSAAILDKLDEIAMGISFLAGSHWVRSPVKAGALGKFFNLFKRGV